MQERRSNCDLGYNRITLGVILSMAVSLGETCQAAPANTLHMPDLSNIIPTADMSILQTATGREFRYTHNVYNSGAGPLEIQPTYSSSTGVYQGFQHIYTHDANNNWILSQAIPVAGAFEFHPEHGHFHFPLAAFGLYAVAPDGGVGTSVAPSPKIGFCIGDSYLFNSLLPHAGAFSNWGSCTDPSSMRGLSVGAVDQYDYRDPGQSIPIDGLPDGTYWFRAIADPYNYLTESDESNNFTDVKLIISNNTVQTLTTTNPDSTPPAVDMTAPQTGDSVSGTFTLTASTGATGGVQFLLDGKPLGNVIAAPPYTLAWDTSGITNGSHWLSVRATDAAGRIGTSAVAQITVTNTSAPPPAGTLALDRTFSQDGRGAVSTSVSTSTAGEVLVAFVAADGPSASPQTANVSGGGLNWSLVRRANTQAGTSEIWTAVATGTLTNATVSAGLASPDFDLSLTVSAFRGAAGLGASITGGAPNGAPKVEFTSTRAGSLIFGVGNDWDRAVARTPAAGQALQHQWVDTRVNDTFWVQLQSAPVAAAGTIVNIADTAPTNDRWNLAAVEIAPQSQSLPDADPPSITITDPAAGSAVSGIVNVAATATDNTGVTRVQFYLDGSPLGAAVTAPPFMTPWDTRTATAGPHTLTASAEDAAHNVGTAASVAVNVDNSAPPPKLIGQEATVFRDGSGTMTTPAFSTATSGDVLVAFVAYDGPLNAAQTATVSGAGLTWTLVKRSNTQAGTAEIWSAKAGGALSNVAVSSQAAYNSFHGSLTVVAFSNATGVGIAGAAAAPSGAPNIYLPGIAAGNWVFAVGNDWDRAIARTPASGQALVHQQVDTTVNDTFWVQSTAAPATALGIVEIRDTAPTADRWNYAAVEIVAAH